jgi:Fe-S-cluster containining protein
MGEAKRRSHPKVTAIIGADLQLSARNAGSPSTYLRKQRAEHPAADRAVPCAGCTECCYTEHLPVDPQHEPPERLAKLDTVPTADGRRELRKRDDGACVHLGAHGCSVYADRPTICRTYDCRVSALLGLVERYRDGHHAPAWAACGTQQCATLRLVRNKLARRGVAVLDTSSQWVTAGNDDAYARIPVWPKLL